MTVLLWTCGVLAYVAASIGVGALVLRHGGGIGSAANIAGWWPLALAVAAIFAVILLVGYSAGWAMETLARKPDGPPVAGYWDYMKNGFGPFGSILVDT